MIRTRKASGYGNLTYLVDGQGDIRTARGTAPLAGGRVMKTGPRWNVHNEAEKDYLLFAVAMEPGSARPSPGCPRSASAARRS